MLCVYDIGNARGIGANIRLKNMNVASKEVHEAELTHFWAISAELRRARRKKDRNSDITILHGLEELEATIMHTEQPALRERCLALVAEYAEEPKSADVCQLKSS